MITKEQKVEIQMLIRSLNDTLNKAEGNARINIHEITVETTNLIIDLLENYLKKKG